MVLKVCVICGDEFDGHGLSKTCGEACRKESRHIYMLEYRAMPGNIAKRYIWQSDYIKKPKVKEKQRIMMAKYNARPENKEKHRIREANRRARKKEAQPEYFESAKEQSC